MRKLILPALLAGVTIGTVARAQAQDDARAVVERAVKAHGGEEKLAKTRAVREKARGVLHHATLGKIEFTTENLVQLPGQFKVALQSESQGRKETVVQVLNGDRGWIRMNGETTPADDKMLATWKDLLYVGTLTTLVPLLRDKTYQLTLADEVKVGDRPAVGVRVAAKGRKDVVLYFDKETGLLVLKQFETVDPDTLKDATHQEVLSDYQEIDGVKRPMQVVVYKVGKKYMEGKVTELKFLDKVDEREFGKP